MMGDASYGRMGDLILGGIGAEPRNLLFAIRIIVADAVGQGCGRERQRN